MFAEEIIEELPIEAEEVEVDEEELIVVEPDKTTTPEENEGEEVEKIERIEEPITIQPDVKK